MVIPKTIPQLQARRTQKTVLTRPVANNFEVKNSTFRQQYPQVCNKLERTNTTDLGIIKFKRFECE
jgi:hypothetical protein